MTRVTKKAVEIAGQTSGCLTALSRDLAMLGQKNSYWTCRCGNCGQESSVSYSNFKMKRKSCIHCRVRYRIYPDKTYQCEVCGQGFVANNKVHHVVCSEECLRLRTNEKQNTDRRSSLRGSLAQSLAGARARSKLRGREFNIDNEYLFNLLEQQNGRCPRTGQELLVSSRCSKGRRETNSQTISIDRVDSSKGYVKGNIELVCYHYNVAKSRFTTQEFEDLCRNVLVTSGYTVHKDDHSNDS